MTFDQTYAVILLAAGDSGRMGVPKLSLTFRKGVSFVEQCVLQFLLFGSSKVAVVVNQAGMQWIEQQQPRFPGNVQPQSQHPGNIKVVLNSHPERGRFCSLQQGLHHSGTGQAVFVHNVDNPFVSLGTLQAMNLAAQRHEGFAWISPRYKGRGGHPILLSAGLAEAIVKQESGIASLKEYLSHEKRTDIDLDDPAILLNINTKDDYLQAGLPMAR